MISLAVARATARDRLFSRLTLAVAVFVILLAFGRSSLDEWGAEAFGLTFRFLVVVAGAALLSEEVESGHAQLVLLRPLTRAQWVSGRFLGAGAVVCAVGTIAWACSLISNAAAGQWVGRLAVLPIALTEALAWLATFLALSAVLRGWTNVAVGVAAKIGWATASFLLPLRFAWLHDPLRVVDSYAGPQKAYLLARALQFHERLVVSPWLYNVFWLLGAWLLAIVLFNRTELARRRT